MTKMCEIEVIVNDLVEKGCCRLCINRYVTVSSTLQESLKAKDEESDEKISCSHPKSKKKNPCIACLGILSEASTTEQTDVIVTAVEGAKYDAKEISFALSLPVALLIRNYSLWIYLRDKYPSYYLDRQVFHDVYGTSDDLKQDFNVVPLKESWKTLLGQELARRLGKQLSAGTDSPFIVNVNFEYGEDDKESACMAEMHPDIFADRSNHKRKYHNQVVFTRKSVEQALVKTERDLFEKHCTIPPEIPSSEIVCSSVTFFHDSLYIAGRYSKYSRTLSQTPWLINGERRMENSVEELIREPISKKIPHEAIKFSSSGREDVDVRMLGRGRPFVLDIQNPRVTRLTFDELRHLEHQINSSTTDIFVRDLQIVPREDLRHIKSGEQTKTKTYQCFCVAKKTVDESEIMKKIHSLKTMTSFVIQQKTPIRVLHRRPLAVRPRTVHWMRAEEVSSTESDVFFKLSVKVEAGTYIKELVHGEFGRTAPSVSLILGVEADILALDVEEIDLEWPPSVEATPT